MALSEHRIRPQIQCFFYMSSPKEDIAIWRVYQVPHFQTQACLVHYEL